MTDGIANPRFNPAREGASRIRIDLTSGGSGGGSRALTWLLMLVLVGGGLGGAYWAHDAGHIEIPGLNEVLAKVNLPGLDPSPERLLAPGSEPLGELRYTWAEGLVVSNVLSVQVESAVTVAGTPAESEPLPGVRALVKATLGATTPDGGRFWNFELEQLALIPPTGSAAAPAPELQEQLGPVSEGFRGTLLVSSRGEIEQSRIDFPGAPAELQPLFDQLSETLALTLPTLPEEPIGLGARWRTALRVPGADATLDADHELTALDETGATLESTLSTGAELPDSFNAPGLAQDAGELVALRTSGTLSRQLDLAGLVTSLDGETTVEAQLSSTPEGGEPRDIEVVTTYRTTVRGL